ncbi:Uncharacterised protein [Neisseria zoodegmatis]|uniref:Uncharacterized protein n=1 Tax=Neisseria zoodegmatis TaxID=326523 RepID=A0A378WIJ0_9NEIS|nr:Uncharacterised protein [Neisseria zoodegmatis]
MYKRRMQSVSAFLFLISFTLPVADILSDKQHLFAVAAAMSAQGQMQIQFTAFCYGQFTVKALRIQCASLFAI